MKITIHANNVFKVASEALEQTLTWLYQNEPKSDMILMIEDELERRDSEKDEAATKKADRK